MEKQQILQEQGAKTKADGNVTDDGTGIIVGKSLAKVSRMPYFDEERDLMDSYFGLFEHFPESQK